MLLYLVVNDLLVEAREALSKVVEVVEPQTQSNNINDNRPNIAGSAVVGGDVQVEVEGKEITNANSSASVKAISASWCVVQNISLFALCLYPYIVKMIVISNIYCTFCRWTAVSFFGGVYTVIILDALMK
jgi:hypothetical protein